MLIMCPYIISCIVMNTMAVLQELFKTKIKSEDTIYTFSWSQRMKQWLHMARLQMASQIIRAATDFNKYDLLNFSISPKTLQKTFSGKSTIWFFIH